MKKRAILLSIFAFSAFALFSQTPDSTKRPQRKAKIAIPTDEPTRRTGSSVVDDSTKNIYGPTTTRWTTEHDIFIGQKNYRPVDTVLLNYHRWTAVQEFNNFYQDLGNNGTALNPIFPQIQTSTIGVSPGFTAYGKYFQSQQIKLFDTKSPYTRMKLVWGGTGRAATRVEFSRNITPRWNFGFDYNPILTDKQILRAGKGDRNVISHYYDVYTHYSTKDDKYKMIFSYQRIRHRVNENGGITFLSQIAEDSSYASYFGAVSPILKHAASFEQHNLVHVYQQYAIKRLQVYHSGDWSKQMNWYKDDLAKEVTTYYDNLQIDSPKQFVDSTRFSFFQNQMGLKGQIGKTNQLFFNGYYRIKSYNMFYKHLNVDSLGLSRHSDEHYLGGQIQYSRDSIHTISAWYEVLAGGYTRAEAEGHFSWIDFTVKRLRSKPTFLQTAYSGQFDYWSNDFKSPESTQATAFPKVQLGPLFLSPGVTFTSVNNFIYFRKGVYDNTDQTVLPVQAQSTVAYATPEFRMDLAILKKIHLRPQILYSKILADRDSALQIPKFFINGQLSYETTWFKNAIQVQLGVDLHWHSSYRPMGYDPAIQTFYNQYDVKPPARVLADIFLNGKIKRGRFFIKYHNVVQRFTGIGMMPTPYYRAMQYVLDFGFELLLFD